MTRLNHATEAVPKMPIGIYVPMSLPDGVVFTPVPFTTLVR